MCEHVPKPREFIDSCDRGRWFQTAGYWLWPLGVTISFPGLKKKRNTLSDPKSFPDGSDRRRPRPATRAEAQARAAKIVALFKESNEAEVRLYNAQPAWRLRELSIERTCDVPDVVKEFLQMVGRTSGEYCWPMSDPGNEISWRIHGWKHVTYEGILHCWRDLSSGLEPAVNRAAALGEDDKIRQLFSAAAHKDPEALGIIWSQFPDAQDHAEIIEYIFSQDERPRGLQHPSDLAADLVDTIFSLPGSDEAHLARIALLKLISVSVARGSRSRKGRPRTRIPIRTLRLLWKMSYCLTKQVRELNDFLDRYRDEEKDRRSLLQEAYPWICQLSSNIPDFLAYEPSKSSLSVVSHVAGVSTSFLQKMGLRHRI